MYLFILQLFRVNKNRKKYVNSTLMEEVFLSKYVIKLTMPQCNKCFTSITSKTVQEYYHQDLLIINIK